jgi:hypothetical protein
MAAVQDKPGLQGAGIDANRSLLSEQVIGGCTDLQGSAASTL